MDESGDWSTASHCRGPSLIHVGFVVDEIVLRQVFCENTPSDTFATAAYSHLTPDPGTVGRSAKGSAPPHPSSKIHDISGTSVCYSADRGLTDF